MIEKAGKVVITEGRSMRSYKFRYFKKSIKQMVPVRSMYFGEPELGADGGISVNDGLELIAPSDLMQFTGLKDKNGRDIYEGDITDCGVVQWFDELSWGSGESIHPGFYFKSGWGDPGDLRNHEGFDNVEVIGNVYENPELKGRE